MKGARLALGSFFFLMSLNGCTLFATRPVQDMSDTSAALRAAREVQADTLAPELYRKANDWFLKAKQEYKFKNFDLAKQYAAQARSLAEMAEFESIRAGGNRTSEADNPPDPMSSPNGDPQSPPAEPYPYATPTGTPAAEEGATSPTEKQPSP